MNRPPVLHAPPIARRRLLHHVGAVAAFIALPAVAQRRMAALAPMMEGPFYPPRGWRERWTDWDADLATVQRDGTVRQARGELLALQALVRDTDGRALDGAEVEIWQCDASSVYRHPRVADAGDPGFAGFGAARSDAQGALSFRTIRPVAYPGRTPHIHVRVRHASFGELTSQLFVAGDPGNARDFLWRSLEAAEQEALAMRLTPAPQGSGLRWITRHELVVPA